MEIRPVSGCAVGKGLFSSFAGYEESDILPIRLVTECRENHPEIAAKEHAQDFGPGLGVRTGYPGEMFGARI